MEKSGFIFLHRKIDGWKYRKDPCVFSIWLWLLTNVKFKETYDSFGNFIKIGSISTSTRAISGETGVSHVTVSRILKKLKSETQIETQEKSNCTIISICNWGKHQDMKQEVKHRCNTGETQVKHRCNNINNDNNENNENNENIYGGVKNSTSDNFKNYAEEIIINNKLSNTSEDIISFMKNIMKVSTEVQGKWLEDNSPEEILFELEKFKNYIEANGKKYKNYNSAFSNWLKSTYRNKQQKKEIFRRCN